MNRELLKDRQRGEHGIESPSLAEGCGGARTDDALSLSSLAQVLLHFDAVFPAHMN